MSRVSGLLIVVALLQSQSVVYADEPRRAPARGPAHHPAVAAPAAGEAPIPVPTMAELPAIVAKLKSSDTNQVREAIDQLTVLDSAEAIAPLAELLRSGQPDALTDRALEAFAALQKPESISVLVEFTHHRRGGARRRAYQALASIHDSRVPALVERGLRDSDRNVRATCALSLGEIHATSSVNILFRAFDRGVLEAATSIGKVGDAQAVERFSQSLGRQPLSVMLDGYDQFLRRADIDEKVKLGVVAKLGEVSGPIVKTFLRQYLGTFSERDRGELRHAVEETMRRIPDGQARGSSTPTPAAAPAGGAR